MAEYAHYIILVDGEEFINLPGDVWEGKQAFHECEQAREAIGWKTLALRVYRPRFGTYTTEAVAQIGGGY